LADVCCLTFDVERFEAGFTASQVEVVKLIDFGAGHWSKTGPLQAADICSFLQGLGSQQKNITHHLS
jgi:tRNA A-37 threonylcarbamoyl transferase component Bud32